MDTNLPLDKGLDLYLISKIPTAENVYDWPMPAIVYSQCNTIAQLIVNNRGTVRILQLQELEQMSEFDQKLFNDFIAQNLENNKKFLSIEDPIMSWIISEAGHTTGKNISFDEVSIKELINQFSFESNFNLSKYLNEFALNYIGLKRARRDKLKFTTTNENRIKNIISDITKLYTDSQNPYSDLKKPNYDLIGLQSEIKKLYSATYPIKCRMLSNRVGKNKNVELANLIWHLIILYETGTGTKTSVCYNGYDKIYKGSFYDFCVCCINKIDPKVIIKALGKFIITERAALNKRRNDKDIKDWTDSLFH